MKFHHLTDVIPHLFGVNAILKLVHTQDTCFNIQMAKKKRTKLIMWFDRLLLFHELVDVSPTIFGSEWA